MEGQPASFSFSQYSFDNIRFSVDSIIPGKPFKVGFNPSCVFSKAKSSANLELEVAISSEGAKLPFCEVSCKASFIFNEVYSIDEIPQYFYANSLAIIYPYIRAMISLISVQANIGVPIVLPVLNLSSLSDKLKQETREE